MVTVHLVILFHCIEGLQWSDGEAIDANDMVFTYQTVRDLGMLGAWTYNYPLATENEDGTCFTRSY